MADYQHSITALNDSSTQMFSDQLVLRDLIVRAVINEQNVSVSISAVLSVHISTHTAPTTHTTLDHTWVTRTIEHVTLSVHAVSLHHLAEEIAVTLLAKIGNVPRVTLTLTQSTALAKAEVHVTRSKAVVPPYKFGAAPYVLEAPEIVTKLGNIPTVLPSPTATPTKTHRAILGMGSNINDRIATINSALSLLAQFGTIIRLSYLYESPAKYVVDQPDFLNLCLIIDTELSAMAVLKQLKSIEAQLGRAPLSLNARNGPRVIDIDLLYYDRAIISKSVLVVPHPSIYERDFVLRPLVDIAPDYHDPVKSCTLTELWAKYSSSEPVKLKQVTPVTWRTKLGEVRQVMWCVKDYSTSAEQLCATKLVGVLNVTQDSFSGDGLAKNSNDLGEVTTAAVTLARNHVIGGADLIEIGGESTRPGAAPVPAELEVARVTHVIRALRTDGSFDNVPLIVDTVKSEVARAALESGGNVLNDVSGNPSEAMLLLARDHNVPIVLQHSRGTPLTMSRDTDYGVSDEHVIEAVASELRAVIDRALQLGVKPWLIITDPGLGFAKTPAQSLSILRHLARWHTLIGGYPLYIGPSRKGFIGHVTGHAEPQQRVWGTAAAVTASVAGGAQFVRVHDLPAMRDVTRVSDVIFKTK